MPVRKQGKRGVSVRPGVWRDSLLAVEMVLEIAVQT